MAFSISISPQAINRPNLKSKSPRHKPKPKPKPKSLKPPKPNPPRQPPSLSTAPGGEATTYTRLPPRDDSFSFSSPSSTSEESSLVIKLSDLAIPNPPSNQTRNRKKFSKNVSHDKPSISKIASKTDDSKFDFGKFQLFEGDDDGEDDDELELGIEGSEEWIGVGEGEEDEQDEGEIEVKEKGIPAVMRCFDRAKIFVKAGDGGNGVMAFRREKYVPLGGPSGGDGGRGGNVYLEVDWSMSSLLPFRQTIHFRAGRGSHGQGKKMHGAKGEDVVVKVPPGTIVKNGEDGEVLLELLRPGERALVLPGGKGGRGNASFKSGLNKVPKIAEDGEEGAELWLELELKLVADVGIVGAPNAGKSTLLSVVSAAQPNIANYPFTTLLPNLGVVSFDYNASMVVADLPGLLEGAHRGFGLGHEFLRHTERCSALVHIVDGSSLQPEYEYDAVRLELEMFSPEIAEKPFIVAFNKMDLPEAQEKWMSFNEKLCAQGIKTFCMSAVKQEGTHEVICAAYELVRKKLEDAKNENWSDPVHVNLNHVADMVQKQRTSPISEFEISHDNNSNTWHVKGAGLERFVQMTNWKYIDSDKRFQNVLDVCGVNKSLLKQGVKEGDTVIIGEMELVWHDYPDNNSPSSTKKRSTDIIRWPQYM